MGEHSWKFDFHDGHSEIGSRAPAAAVDDSLLLAAVRKLSESQTGFIDVEQQIRDLSGNDVSVDEIAARGGLTVEMVRQVLAGADLETLMRER
ncbi:hypothetical protein K2F54_18615 [Cryobacterium sp. 1639]|uniref:hypothetical protein n=1 Tax=Cryobacterium inferilacus TaxID=2866629 RepID=UPI001C729FCD|nr:hypothetical protein [Cryobacterium sp. 1639]MBX0301978.1 hypothetical protein [Cryobacterium sp. 1639]